MKKLVVVLILIAIIFISGCLNYLPNPRNDNQNDFIYPEPDWVTEIKNKIDLSKCSADNCQACDKNSCKNYPNDCKIENKMYECGPIITDLNN